MSSENITHMLEHRGIKPTAMRILVLREMMECNEAFSLQTLEDRLDTVDKSTRSCKYAVCSSSCHCGEDGEHLDDLHAHFYCERCHRTFCLSRIQVPVVSLPGEFQVHDINYVLKGVCPKCNSSTH